MQAESPKSNTAKRIRRRWRRLARQSLKIVQWAGFVYAVPGMLFVVLLLALWTLPAVLIMLTLLAAQLPVWLAFRRLIWRDTRAVSDEAIGPSYRDFQDWLPPREKQSMTGPSLRSWARLDAAQRRR